MMPSGTDSGRLRALIEASGLSQVRFALGVLGRDPSTVRRWLAGGTMPATVQDWLARLTSVRTSDRAVTIDVLRS